MRYLTLALIATLLLLQWHVWFGKGSWLRVWQLNQQLQTQQELNAKLEARNRILDAEVVDLKSGTDAVEEHARNGLGLVKDGEIYFQISSSPQAFVKN